jgi:outer membrane protein OmpA-like peptidoglycan-associated protein
VNRTRLPIVVTAVALAGAGCATQEWTREWTSELFAKRQAEVEDRFRKTEARTEARVHDQSERLERVEVQVASLESRLGETREMARGAVAAATASKQAQAARTDAAELRAPRPAPDWVPRAARTLVGVVHVPFGFDRADVDVGAATALTAIVKELHENPQMTIDLEGTTDPAGRLEYNMRLSQRRVETVKKWLLSRGIEPGRIVQSLGRGPLVDATVRDEGKRRVTVKLMTATE